SDDGVAAANASCASGRNFGSRGVTRRGFDARVVRSGIGACGGASGVSSISGRNARCRWTCSARMAPGEDGERTVTPMISDACSAAETTSATNKRPSSSRTNPTARDARSKLFFLAARQQLLDLRGGDRPRHALATGKDQRRRAVDALLAAVLDDLVDRIVRAIRIGRRRDLLLHVIVPGLDPIRRAPDLLGDLGGIGMQRLDRIQEHVKRHVIDLGKVALDALAERAIGIGEDRELALTLALYFLESEIERQLVERYGRQRALALLGQIGHVLRRNDIAIDEVLEFLVGIE